MIIKNYYQVTKLTTEQLISALRDVNVNAKATMSRHTLIEKVNKAYNLGMKTLNTMSRTELANYVASMGKRANERIASIERSKLTNTSAYQYITSKMTNREQALSHSSSGHVKFNVQTRKKTRAELLAQATRIQRFNEALSSTTTGINTLHKEALKTFNKRYSEELGKKLTMKEFTTLVTNANWNHFKSFGSEQVFKMIRQIGFKEAITLITEGKNITQIRDIDRAIKKVKKQKEREGKDFKWNKIDFNELPRAWRR